jgi:2-C-methyl-D-erythritol 4-phosphate cytidylyltransferase
MSATGILLCAGSSSRMGFDKLNTPLCGKTAIARSTDALLAGGCDSLVFVVNGASEATVRTLSVPVPFAVVSGGEQRTDSVKNGLAKVRADVELVGVHDGVRPFVSVEVIQRCYDEARRSGAAIPVIDVFETIRHLTPTGSETVPRSEYKLVQTPQVFQTPLLRQAYEQAFTEFFTDDASVVEALGHQVALVPGNRENIKITTPADLK